MIGPSRSDCHRHRAALLDFADHRDVAAVDAASLDHLDRCPDCRLEVEAAALTVVALRRLAAEAQRAEPSDDAWSRLRARVGHRGSPWRWRAPLGGLAMSAALVAIVLAPVAWLRPPAPYLQEAGLQASIFDARRAAEDLSEQAILQQQLATRTAPIVFADPAPPVGQVEAVWSGPDGLGQDLQPAPDAGPAFVRHT